MYPILVPFYLFGKTLVAGTEKVEGGVPQLADYYLLGTMCLAFATLPFQLNRSTVAALLAFIGFVCYTALVNSMWAVHLEDLSLLKSTLFYAYDVMLLLTCLLLYSSYKEDFLRVTAKAVGISVVLQALLSPFAPQSIYSRQAAFFNNENQLGYFCLLAAIVFVLGARRFNFPLRYQFVFYSALTYLALLAQSRAALLGLGTLSILALLAHPFRLLLALSVVAAAYFVIVNPELLSKSAERLAVQGGYDTPGGRGYDRIVNYPEHLLVGAGEGAYTRFRSELFGSEIHSSYGTLLFCYGIPGTLLFTLALVSICRRDPRVVLFMIPAFVHGIGHQGLRFAFFWTTLAFLCCCAATAPATESECQSDDAPLADAFPLPAT